MRRLVLIRKVILGISEEGMITLRSKEDEALIRYKITQKIQENSPKTTGNSSIHDNHC